MYALQQIVKGSILPDQYDQLAVQHEVGGLELMRGGGDLRKIPRQRALSLGLQLDMIAVPKQQAAEAIPFWLVLPLRPDGHLIDERRFHRGERRMDRQRCGHLPPSGFFDCRHHRLAVVECREHQLNLL
jgi:hypothetical protein